MTTMASVEALTLAQNPAWLAIKRAAGELQTLQSASGAIEDFANHATAAELVGDLIEGVGALAPEFPYDADYLTALVADFESWRSGGFREPDFLASLTAFQPQQQRVDGLTHLVVFPMYTQNGSTERHVEAVLLQVIWPDFLAALEASDFGNPGFLSVRFLDFTSGYDGFSAVLFPETVSVREVPTFTWGAIFADREAARFRRVLKAGVDATKLQLPGVAAEMLGSQKLTEETFAMWDLIHDRAHVRGPMPFDPFMIKQRMPYFLYSLEELRCDLTAFREAVRIERMIARKAEPTASDQKLHMHARLVQYCVLFDRIFRFAVSGDRHRNYDGLGGQLLFAWLHKRRVLNWSDGVLSFEWSKVADTVNALGDEINDLYFRGVDRPRISHWLAAYDLVAETVEPHPASAWRVGDLPLTGSPKELTDLVMDDEFPLSMFYEAFAKKMRPVIASTAGITGRDEV